MHKRVLVAMALALAVLLVPSGASAAEPVTINFVASGPVLNVAPTGYEGAPSEGPLDGQNVKLKFQKKVDGEWVTKKSRTRQIDGTIVYGEPTPTFRRGKCRIVAIYAGDATYAAAKKANLYTCKTGMLIYS